MYALSKSKYQGGISIQYLKSVSFLRQILNIELLEESKMEEAPLIS